MLIYLHGARLIYCLCFLHLCTLKPSEHNKTNKIYILPLIYFLILVPSILFIHSVTPNQYHLTRDFFVGSCTISYIFISLTLVMMLAVNYWQGHLPVPHIL